MTRGQLFLVSHPNARDPRRSRVFVVVSRQVLIDSKFSTVICAPIYTNYHGLGTQVLVGVDEGLKHESSIHCDELVSLRKSMLSNFVGQLSPKKIAELRVALAISLEIE
ncbi:MAG: type II toxin-antitoxin system PemK/MazF family toxin [Thiohalocapsa sp. PB-PSB1]|jgi:mRNA interferase MazF|nr:MAG: type II toxin-antitoxin system PemK/MazF family toxin [Thiohalocapsa sp. PB-PSB1]HCS92272.1 MazF family transcriptional regulator [Chromatiaceae bacterium]